MVNTMTQFKSKKTQNPIHDLYCKTCGIKLGKYWGNKPPKGITIYCGHCGTTQKPYYVFRGIRSKSKTDKRPRYIKRILK